jgi:hypothetical protein
MKLFKSIYRYALAGILLAAAVTWTVFCSIRVAELKSFAVSTGFIDLALKSTREADQLLLQLEQFKQLRTTGIVAIVVMVLVIGAMVAWQILSKRWEKAGKNPISDFFRSLKDKKAAAAEKKAAEKKAAEEKLEAAKKAAAEKEEPAEKGFCPNCGKPYEKEQGFCTECGFALTEK